MAANTISTLSYANTFGDWVVATNFLITQNNQAASNSFTKQTGTYYFNDPTLGLQVANNAIIGGQLQVVGTGSSALVQNGLTAGQGTFTNTSTALTVAGSAVFSNTIYANGISGLSVANSATVGGSLTVGANTTLNTLVVANGASFTGTTTYAGSLIVGGSTAYNFGTNQWNISITGSAGNANTVTNGVYSNQSYSDPAWITALSASKLIGTVVYTITGTQNQVYANTSTGNIQLSLPQSINTNSAPSFVGLNIAGTANVGGLNIIGSSSLGTIQQSAGSYVYPGYQTGQGTGVNNLYYLAGSTTYGLYSNTGFYASGPIYSTGNITAYYSDRRLKSVLYSIPNALEKVQSLNGFVYIENDKAKELGFDNTRTQVGLSAQEVQSILPEAVSLAPFDMDENKQSKSGENYLTVDYARLVPLLVQAIKELKAEVDSLKQ